MASQPVSAMAGGWLRLGSGEASSQPGGAQRSAGMAALLALAALANSGSAA